MHCGKRVLGAANFVAAAAAAAGARGAGRGHGLIFQDRVPFRATRQIRIELPAEASQDARGLGFVPEISLHAFFFGGRSRASGAGREMHLFWFIFLLCSF